MSLICLATVSENEEWLHALRHLSVEDLLPLLLQLAIIIGAVDCSLCSFASSVSPASSARSPPA